MSHLTEIHLCVKCWDDPPRARSAPPQVVSWWDPKQEPVLWSTDSPPVSIISNLHQQHFVVVVFDFSLLGSSDLVNKCDSINKSMFLVQRETYGYETLQVIC